MLLVKSFRFRLSAGCMLRKEIYIDWTPCIPAKAAPHTAKLLSLLKDVPLQMQCFVVSRSEDYTAGEAGGRSDPI